MRLANEQGVKIDYHIKSYDEFQAEENSFDLIALIYAHHSNRHINHRKLIKYLKPGGYILLEGFAKNQLEYGTGGPPTVQLLFSAEELKEDFKELSHLEIEQKIKHLSEGENHSGDSSIIRLKGIK